MSFKILKENIFEDKENRKDIHNGRDLLPFLASEVDYNIRDYAERDTFRDAVEEGHCDDAEICGNRCCVIVFGELQVCDVAEHEEANDDESGSCCKRGDRCEDGCEQGGNEEKDPCCERGKTCSAACRNAGSGFNESCGGGRTESGTCGSCNSVCHQSGLDSFQFAVLIKHICFCADTDERAERIEKVNEEEGENDNDKVEDINAVFLENFEVEALTNGFAELCEICESESRVERIEACIGIGNVDANELAKHTEPPSNEDTDENGAFHALYIKESHEQRTDDGKERTDTDGIKFFREVYDGNERGAVNAELCILQADERDEKTDTNGNRVFQLQGNGIEDRFSDVCEREKDEDDTFSKYRKECDLPGVAHLAANGVRHECVQTHAGGKNEGVVCPESHERCTDEGSDTSGEQNGCGIHAGFTEDAGVDCQNVSHRHKGSNTGNDFCFDIGVVFFELEDFV